MDEFKVDGDVIAEVVAYLNGHKTVPAQRMADAVLRLLNRHYQDAAALEAAREDAIALASVRTHLPTRVETDTLGDYTPEECAAFDAGYNAALDRAHNLLNRRPGAIAAIDQARVIVPEAGQGVGGG